MGGVFAVAGKEFRTFFLTPIGYVILVVFSLLAGWWVFHPGRFLENQEADLRVLFQFFPWAFLLFGPAVTMRLWAEERKQNTFETLMTTPLRPGQLVLGKFLAGTGAVLVWLACLLPIPLVVLWVGDPDPGPLWGGMLSALLLGASYVAIGLCVSAATENQIIALIGAFAVALAFFLLSQPVVGELFPGVVGALLHQASLDTHFQSVQRGVLDLRDGVYYLSFIAFFLYWNAWLVGRRRSSPFNVVLAAAVALLANVFVRTDAVRVDLTEDGRFSLSPVSHEILDEQLQGPLKLSAYLSSSLPGELRPIRGYTQDLLTELAARHSQHIELEILDPSTDEEAAEAARRAGLSEFSVPPGSAEGPVFLGVHLEYFDQELVLRSIRSMERLEYGLMVRLDRITRPHPLVVGFHVNEEDRGRDLRGRARPPGPDDRHTPDFDLRTLDAMIRERFDTLVLDLRTPVPDDVRTLVLCNGAKMGNVQKYWLDQYLMRGGHLVVLMEGTERALIGGRDPGKEEVRRGHDCNIDDLLSSWGIRIHHNVVLDSRCGMQGNVPFPPAVRVLEDSIVEHPLTVGVRQVFLPFVSSIALEPRPGAEATPLIRSSEKATEELSTQTMILDGAGIPDPREEPEAYVHRFLLAGLMEGSFHSLYAVHGPPDELAGAQPLASSPPDTRILVVGSSSFVSDPVVKQVAGSLGVTNLELVLNACGAFTADRDFAPLQSKRLSGRPFTAPDSTTRILATFVGAYMMPLLLLVAAFTVYWWRRVWRPEQARLREEARRGARGESA